MTRGVVRLVERIFERIPLVKILYTSLRDMIAAFFGERKRFDRPVLVAPGPESPVRVIGFVTREDLDELGLPGWVSVYLPQSYNFAGQTVLLPREQVEPMAGDAAELLQFVVSGGISGPPDEEEDPSSGG